MLMMELAQGYDEELKEKLDDEIPDREFLPHLKDLCLVTLQYVHDGEPLVYKRFSYTLQKKLERIEALQTLYF